MRRSRIIHSLIVLRQSMHAHIVDIEHDITNARFPLYRIFLSIKLFFLYVAYACCFSLAVLFLSPAQSFEYFHQPSPETGYTNSYARHRSWSRGLRLSGIATTIVLVSVTLVNVMALTQRETKAVGDQRLLSVDFSASSYLPRTTNGEYVTYTFDFATTEELHPEDPIWLYLLPEGNTDPTASGIDFTNAVVDFGNLQGAEFISENNGTVGHIQILNSLPAGPIRLTVTQVLNPSIEGNYVAAVSTASTLSADRGYMASSTFEITDGVDCSIQEIDHFTSFSFGNVISTIWNAFTDATGYTIAWWPTADDTAEQTATLSSETSYLITGLETNTAYSVQLIAGTALCELAAQASTTATTDTQTITDQEYAAPRVPRAKRKQKQVTVEWNTDEGVSSYTLQLFNAAQQVQRTMADIPSSTTARVMKKLHPGKKYFVRLSATYSNDESTQFSSFVAFRTKQKKK